MTGGRNGYGAKLANIYSLEFGMSSLLSAIHASDMLSSGGDRGQGEWKEIQAVILEQHEQERSSEGTFS